MAALLGSFVGHGPFMQGMRSSLLLAAGASILSVLLACYTKAQKTSADSN